MTTTFDILTVACFVVMTVAFFVLRPKNPRTLLHLLLSGVLFAVANQVGNAGYTLLGLALIAAGAGYSVLVLRS
jgi:hypothetical protein